MAGLGTLTTNTKAMGTFAIVVAVTLAILQGFQANNGAVVGGNSSNAYVAITTFVGAIDDFATWAAVIVLGIVGFFLLRYMSQKA